MSNVEIIFGAPGCGKTTYLIDVLEKELKENDPDKIAFVSFTKKGVNEGKMRAMEKFNYKEIDLPYFRTLHSIAFKEGHYSMYDMITKKDYKTFSKAMGMKFTGYYTEEFFHNDDRYLFLNFLERNNFEIFKLYIDTINLNIYKNIKYNYKRFKEHNKVIDFTDMIENFINKKISIPVNIAIIDEAQDLTTLQWEMCEIAFKNCKKVYIAGDDDQCIYSWNGADIDYFLNIKGNRTILKQSYRLQKNILNYANKISDRIINRVGKSFNSINDEGNIFFYNNINELKINENESYYFLSRNNCFLIDHEFFVKNQHQLYRRKNELSINHDEINAINLFEKLRKIKKLNEEDQVRLKPYLNNIINIKDPWFYNLNFNNDKIIYYKDLIKYKINLKKINIDISTIHGVKGGEADNVILTMDFTKAINENFRLNPDSELRCLYVACTRTKKNLYLIHKNTKHGYEDYYNMKSMKEL